MSQIYTLEEFAIIAGDVQTLHFNVFDQENEQFDLSQMKTELKFSLSGQTQYAVLEKTGTLYDTNSVKFTLESSDTVNLRGKYVFQLIITDERDGNVYIPTQGVINVYPQVGV